MQVNPLKPFGVKLSNFVVGSATEDDLRSFVAAFRQHSLVLIHDPNLTPEEQVELIGRLGTVATEVEGSDKVGHVTHDPTIPNGPDFGKGELIFHFDLCATDDWPYEILSLYGEVVTDIGGETKFAHGGQGYARLSEATKELVKEYRAVHISDPYAPPTTCRPTEAMMGTFAERGVHNVVRKHPYIDQDVLTVSYATTDRIVGMPRVEGEKLISEMFDALYSQGAVYVHTWHKGDLLVWDNRVVQHARNDFDRAKPRSLRRVVIGNAASIQARYQRWFEQIPRKEDFVAEYRSGRVLFPGDQGVWYGMRR